MRTPKGILAILINPDGKVWGEGSDFNTFTDAGFSLRDSQERRAQQAMAKSFFKNTCTPIIADILSNDYAGSQIIRQILDKPGWKLHITEIGYGENDDV